MARAGDLWLLSEHRVYCGNALDPKAYAALMRNERASVVFSDPPYNVPISGNVSGLGGLRAPAAYEIITGPVSRAKYLFGDSDIAAARTARARVYEESTRTFRRDR